MFFWFFFLIRKWERKLTSFTLVLSLATWSLGGTSHICPEVTRSTSTSSFTSGILRVPFKLSRHNPSVISYQWNFQLSLWYTIYETLYLNTTLQCYYTWNSISVSFNKFHNPWGSSWWACQWRRWIRTWYCWYPWHMSSVHRSPGRKHLEKQLQVKVKKMSP